MSSLVKQFDAMAALVKQMSQMSMLDKIRAMTGLGRAGAFNPGARLVAPKQGTGKRLSPKEREKLRKEREKEERTQPPRATQPGPRRRRAVPRPAALSRPETTAEAAVCADREGDESNRSRGIRGGLGSIELARSPIETRGRRGLGTGLVLAARGDGGPRWTRHASEPMVLDQECIEWSEFA